jgi:hypothetical protein
MGKKYTHNKDVYVIYIRASSNTNFYRYVGFAITRKQAWLENYVKRNTGAPTLPQPFPNPSALWLNSWALSSLFATFWRFL